VVLLLLLLLLLLLAAAAADHHHMIIAFNTTNKAEIRVSSKKIKTDVGIYVTFLI
jgi:hypothetical protein